MIDFGCINVDAEAKKMVNILMDEGLIGQSSYIELFEREFAKFVGSKYAIAVNNGTMADTIALAVLKNKFPDKRKVAVPALTFIAQVNAIFYNHLTPDFYDVTPKITEETLCVFPVHLLGRPAPTNYEIPVVEDACEAFGSKFRGKFCGTNGALGTFSFFPSHTISTGEGGMIVTDNEEYAELARRLRNHGKVNGDDFKFDLIGFNGKMTSIQAVIGLSLLRQAPELFEKRHDNFIKLGGREWDGVVYIVPHGFDRYYENRDEKREELKAKGIASRRVFSSIPTQEKAYEFLGYKLNDFPNSEEVGRTGLYVPCHQNLTDEEVLYIKTNL